MNPSMNRSVLMYTCFVLLGLFFVLAAVSVRLPLWWRVLYQIGVPVVLAFLVFANLSILSLLRQRREAESAIYEELRKCLHSREGREKIMSHEFIEADRDPATYGMDLNVTIDDPRSIEDLLDMAVAAVRRWELFRGSMARTLNVNIRIPDAIMTEVQQALYEMQARKSGLFKGFFSIREGRFTVETEDGKRSEPKQLLLGC